MAAKLRNLAASQAISILKCSQQSRSVAGKMRLKFDRKSGVSLNLPASVLFNTEDQPANISSFIQQFPTDDGSFVGVSVGKIKTETHIRFHLPVQRLVATVLEVVAKRDSSGYQWMRNALFEDSHPKKVVVEFSSPNIAKPFHVGHLRSTLIGNFVANIHEAVGHQVTRINYLGDWGTQFGLLAAGMEISNSTMDDVREDPIRKMVEIYVSANKLAEENAEFAAKAREAFTKLELGDDELTSQWKLLREFTIQELERTYKRLNIHFDFFHGEAMYGLNKNNEVIQDMIDKGLLKKHEEGKQVVELDEYNIVTVVKSDGSSLYMSRDIAAAVDRKYRFNLDKMCYVVDSSQGPHFNNLFRILSLLGHEWASTCSHVMFGKILGMSTRRGTMVYLSDVLDEARDIMLEEQEKSPNTRIKEEERREVADCVGISAVIVNDLKQRRRKDYKFVWDKFLTHRGDTGVKLQYTHARLHSLLEKEGVHVDPSCCTDTLVEPAAIDLVVLLGFGSARPREQLDSSHLPSCSKMAIPLQCCKELDSDKFDAIVLVAPDAKSCPSQLASSLAPTLALDQAASSKGCVVSVDLPAKRLVFAPTGPLDRDYDDARRFTDAAEAGIKRALSSGSKRPLLVASGTLPGGSKEQAELATLLGGLAAIYVTLEMREGVPEKAKKVEALGWSGSESVYKTAMAMEAGRVVARDIGGSDPERMAAPRVEEYVRKAFQGTGVDIEVVQGQANFEREYPCLAAVNRCASGQERHDGRVIWLTYKPPGNVKKTVYLVGKGITYDTGGADIKAGGVMAGMSRDKCGAAAAAGFMKTVAELKPDGIKVVVALAMVRNSVGNNAYVADEIITSRAGVRLRVGNTDAEGRMAMVDVLCHAKEKALSDPDPQLMTVATLTGHAVLAVGDYSIIMDNGPAKQAQVATKVQAAGEQCGDLFEISTIRRDDWDFNVDKSGEFVSILQCNNAPSSRTPRGHQMPGAFLQQVSRLDAHGSHSEKPLKYSHMDIAGSAGHLPGPTTGAPIPALTLAFLGH